MKSSSIVDILLIGFESLLNNDEVLFLVLKFFVRFVIILVSILFEKKYILN
jgi:hypothetical protein